MSLIKTWHEVISEVTCTALRIKGTMHAAIQVWNALHHIVYIRKQTA